MNEPPAPSAAWQLLFAEALRLHRAGRLADAERLYRQVLAIEPDHADSRHFLGIIAHQVGRYDIAVELIGRAIELGSNQAHYHGNLGNALQALGKLKEAVASYDQALALEPDLADVHYNRANALHALGKLAEAVAGYDRVLTPKPDLVDAHYNRANVLQALGRLDEAIAGYDKAIALEPDHADAHNNRGDALQRLARLDEAVTSYDRALALKPDFAEAHNNRANALRSRGRLDEALAGYDRALAARPDFAEAHGNRGTVLKDQGRLGEAMTSYDTAIELKPDHAEAYSNRGEVLKDQGQHDEALASYDRALVLRPGYAEAHSNLLMGLHYSSRVSGADILARARRFASLCETSLPPPIFPNSRTPTRRLKVGYVSGDFANHPVSYFLKGVLAAHDRKAVEVFCYSNRAAEDDMTGRLRRSANHWQGIAAMPDARAASIIRRDQIDILVDLSGHTGRNRLLLFGHRPAPIQVSWLGYFGTTGLSSMDYILADRFVVRDGEEGLFTERVARLPDSYLCFSPPDMAVPTIAPPSMAGHQITFGNFNNHAKTSPETIGLWARILSGVPTSRLLLKTSALDDTSVRRTLLNQFAGHGIARDRILLEGRSPRAELLLAYNRLDVALDPPPYGGGTTTAEALWMGVPVVTLRGRTWVGRVSESILSTAGLSELVARTQDEYVDIATTLAMDSRRMAMLRSRLRSQLEASAVCDTTRFTRHLERAFRDMWRTWCSS